jgi:methylmalonyl-CoA/ethylmalonyl-CoA epimerase
MSLDRLHHLGLACPSLEAEHGRLAAIGAVDDGAPFVDPGLGIRGRFVMLGDARVELLEEWEASGVLASWLRGPARFYHLAYLVDDLDAEVAALEPGARLIRGPQPAVAFDGRRVAFLVTPSLLMIELVEAPRAG